MDSMVVPLFDRPSLTLRRMIGSLNGGESITVVRRKWIKRNPGPYRVVVKVKTQSGLVGWIDGEH